MLFCVVITHNGFVISAAGSEQTIMIRSQLLFMWRFLQLTVMLAFRILVICALVEKIIVT